LCAALLSTAILMYCMFLLLDLMDHSLSVCRLVPTLSRQLIQLTCLILHALK